MHSCIVETSQEPGWRSELNRISFSPGQARGMRLLLKEKQKGAGEKFVESKLQIRPVISQETFTAR